MPKYTNKLVPTTTSVWVVIAGQYSDKYVVGVYDTAEKAHRAYLAGTHGGYSAHNPPIEYPLNGNLPINDELRWYESDCDGDPKACGSSAPNPQWSSDSEDSDLL